MAPQILLPMVSDLLDLVLPRECGGCRMSGVSWCGRCARALRDVEFPGGPRRVRPEPCPPGLPAVHAWGPYAGVLRPAVTAWKDEGRRDLDRVLRGPLAASVFAAVRDVGWAGSPVLLVPAPSSRHSRRVRGEVPLERLLCAAVVDLGATGLAALRVAPALQHLRRVSDQAGLGSAGRSRNLQGAAGLRSRWRGVVRGRRVVVVDDVITTGATLSECVRALRTAGAQDVVCAVLAATRRTSTRSSQRPAHPAHDAAD